MDTIGLSASETMLCKRLYANANAYWVDKDAVLASTGTQDLVDATCARLQEFFATIENSNSFHLCIAAERMMCLADLEHFQHSQQDDPNASRNVVTMRTLEEGVAQMKDINSLLALRSENTQLFHRYATGTRASTIKSEHDGEGLPKDGIRKLLSSHQTRLQNRSKSLDAASREEQGLNWHRNRNLQIAEHLYRVMQREAMGIDDKSKSQGHQR